jgi:hypothetical protein
MLFATYCRNPKKWMAFPDATSYASQLHRGVTPKIEHPQVNRLHSITDGSSVHTDVKYVQPAMLGVQIQFP